MTFELLSLIESGKTNFQSAIVLVELNVVSILHDDVRRRLGCGKIIYAQARHEIICTISGFNTEWFSIRRSQTALLGQS
jgi:hypothetical protein